MDFSTKNRENMGKIHKNFFATAFCAAVLFLMSFSAFGQGITVAATNITQSSAMIMITTDGEYNGYEAVVWYGVNEESMLAGPGVMISSNEFSIELSGLNPATTYYYQVKITYDMGEALSALDSFTTQGATGGTPTVTTLPCEDIESHSVTLNAAISEHENVTILDVGFLYATSTAELESLQQQLMINATVNEGYIIGTLVDDEFTADVYGLSSNTVYYFLAFVRYSDTEEHILFDDTPNSFMTTDDGTAGNIIFEIVQDVHTTSDFTMLFANLSGFSSTAGYTAWGFWYGTTPDASEYSVHGQFPNGNEYDRMYALVNGLMPSTTYYFKAYIDSYESEVVSFTTEPSPSIIVSAYEAEVNGISVTLHGYVSDVSVVSEYGFYYGHHPEVLDQYVSADYGETNFSSLINVAEGMEYFYKAYAMNGGDYIYSSVSTFTAGSIGNSLMQSGDYNNHGYVDLGLSVKWATTNLGATSPEDYGNYYAWGETTPKSTYSWLTYQHCFEDEYLLTKYCFDVSHGSDGFTDDLTTLEAIDDAATANWGAGWRMPTQAEMEELRTSCTWEWTSQNGIDGYIARNESTGFYMFLPAAGYLDESGEHSITYDGDYWTSSLSEYSAINAYSILFYDGSQQLSSNMERDYGLPIRAVYDATMATPTVTTKMPDNVTESSATLQGTYIVDPETPEPTSFGFLYGTDTTSTLTEVSATFDGTTYYIAEITGLTSGTTYYCKFFAENSNGRGYGQFWEFETQGAGQTEEVIFQCDFEDAEQNSLWSLNNASQANYWHIGSAASNGGSNGLYITNDGGDSNEYDSNTTSYAYATIQIWIEQADTYQFDFDWMANGEDNYDNMKAFLVSLETVSSFVDGSSYGMESDNNTTPAGWIDLYSESGIMSEQTSWQHNSNSVVLEEGGYNLVFFWKNDSGGGDNPPAAVDNIVVKTGSGPSDPTGSHNGHGYVDLGLPSGTMWAIVNVGATTPRDYGGYYAWGETETKDICEESNYIYYNGTFDKITKYCNYAEMGNNGFTDDLTILEPSDDAATVNWGDGWRMPTEEDAFELIRNCVTTWTTQNGINGYLITGTNGNSIFLPAAGSHDGNNPDFAGGSGCYWTSTLSIDYLVETGPAQANYITMTSSNLSVDLNLRHHGYSIRPIYAPSQTATNQTGSFTDTRDGRTYDYVVIGEQTWMAENLRYDNSGSMTVAQGSEQSETDPYLYYPNGDSQNLETYGYLYNWPAAMNGAESSDANPSGVQGICPLGWHLPSNAEWTQLVETLGDEANAGAMLAGNASMWTAGSLTASEYFGTSSFNALPSGYYYPGDYGGFGSTTSFWSTTEDIESNTRAYLRGVDNSGTSLSRSRGSKTYGFSVRCIKDAGTVADGPSDPTGTHNNHGYVDLGLPSGTMWATMNVGASSPEDYGNYYAWGETEPKEIYNTDTYRYHDGTDFTKYNDSDGLTTLEPSDDAATVNWGDGWEMPTHDEFIELIENCDTTLASQNGINGILFIGPNGNTIFMPASGQRFDDYPAEPGISGFYNSNSLSTPSTAEYLKFDSNILGLDANDNREYGRTVRPVYKSGNTASNETGTFIDDRDGQTYSYVTIGDQTWMAENLKYSYNMTIATQGETSETDPYLYYPNGSVGNVDLYGYLYNNSAAMNGESSSSENPSGVQGICPNGWHLPSDAEWLQLANYLGGEEIAGAKLAGNASLWTNSELTQSEYFGTTGFMALPAGKYADDYNGFDSYGFGDSTFFWTTTAENGEYYYVRTIQTWGLYNIWTGSPGYQGGYKGVSIRCVKNTDNTASNDSNTHNGHEYVDLGLSVKWATVNVGATSPEEEGNLYSWGGTETKSMYEWINYEHGEGYEGMINKYFTDVSIGVTDPDNLTTLLPEDDAVTVSWGAGWRMPTADEVQELIDNCTIEGSTITGNGNSITLNDARYWTSSLYLDDQNNAYLYDNFSGSMLSYAARYNGYPVRGVYDATLATPTVTTQMPDNVTESSATLQGTYIVDPETPEATSFGFLYGIDTTATLTEVSATFDGNTYYIAEITGLTSGTTYYCKFFAENSNGRGYGQFREFETQGAGNTANNTFTDSRDGQTYATVTIGDQEWMAENLRYSYNMTVATERETSYTDPYIYYPNGEQSNVQIYGYLYNWPAAMNGAESSEANPSGVQGICPNGWHLPSNAEWIQLADALGGETSAGAKLAGNMDLWQTGVLTESEDFGTSGFNALPAGAFSGQYNNFGSQTLYYTTTKVDVNMINNVYIKEDMTNLIIGNVSPEYMGLSVRCVKDASNTANNNTNSDDIIYQSDFENTGEWSEWTLNNSGQTNYWTIGLGSSDVSTTETNCLYITNDGSSYNYNNGAESAVYAYKEIELSSTSNYHILFDWKCIGEESWDYLRAFIIPASENPNLSAGNVIGDGYEDANTTPDGWIDLYDGEMSSSDNQWRNAESTVALSAGNYYLVFYWRNDESAGSNPPAAVDNIFIYKLMPISVTTNVSDRTSTSVTLNGIITFVGEPENIAAGFKWGNSETSLPNNITTQSTGATFSEQLTGLISQTTYYYQAYAVYDGDTAFSEIAEFRTALDESSAGGANNPLLIGDMNDWQDFSNALQNPSTVTYKGVMLADYGLDMYFSLESDLSFTEAGVAFSIDNFKGNLNGNYNTITVQPYQTFTGLFANFSDGHIDNLNLRLNSSGTLEGAGDFGMLCQTSYQAYISNCTVSGISSEELSSSDDGHFVGGLVGNATQTTISGCTNNLKITSEGARVGGIVGRATGTIMYCTNNAELRGAYVGGIVAEGAATITNCLNTGQINCSGSIAGGISGTGGNISSCMNIGEISATGTQRAGGIVGSAESTTTVTNCANYGVFPTFSSPMGGIAGSGSGTYSHNVSAPLCRSTEQAIYSLNEIYATVATDESDYNSASETDDFFDEQVGDIKVDSLRLRYAERGTPKTTAEIVGSQLSGSLSSQYWDFTEDLYPKPQYINETSQTIVARIPIYLGPHQSVFGVWENFSLPTLIDGHQITWASNDNAISISDGTATVTRPASGEDDIDVQITADYDGYTKTFVVRVIAPKHIPVYTGDASQDSVINLTGEFDNDTEGTTYAYDYGFQYSTTSADLSENVTTVQSTNLNHTFFDGRAFSYPLANIPEGTMVYYRAYATTADGTEYGDILNYKSLGAPVVVAKYPLWRTDNSATILFDITLNEEEDFNELENAFYYGTERNNLSLSSYIYYDEDNDNYSVDLHDLAANTKYYYVAEVTNDYGTTRSDTLEFLTYGTMTDSSDFTHYYTIQIGDQTWMAQNLKSVGQGLSLGTTTSETDPYYYYVNGDEANTDEYGYLYNWAAAMNGASSSTDNPSGVQGICPNGWHLPSNAEWTQLTDYLGGTENTSAMLSGQPAGEDQYWQTGTLSESGDFGKSGFNALPAGYYDRDYNVFGSGACFWSATEYNSTGAYHRTLASSDLEVTGGNAGKFRGFSVRCVKGTAVYAYDTVNQCMEQPYSYTYHDTVITTSGDYTIREQIDSVTENIYKLHLTFYPSLTATVNDFSSGCYGANDGYVEVTAGGGAGTYTYNWNTPEAQTTARVNNLGAGEYSVTVTDAARCTATVSQTLTAPSELTASINGNNPNCYGDETALTANASGGTPDYTYNWNSGESDASITVSPTTTTTYTITVTDANNCTATAFKNVVVNSQLTVSISGETAIQCYGGTTDLTANANGGSMAMGYTYAWTGNVTGQNLTGVSAGDYSVVATDGNGCTATAGVAVTQPNAALTVSLSAGTIACSGGTTNINSTVNGGTEPYNYTWTPSGDEENLTGVGAGTYSLRVTDMNGCTATASATVNDGDSEAPLLTGTWPANILGQGNCLADADLNELYSTTQVKTLYEDDSEITVTASDATTGDNCSWTITRTYTIADACGNSTTNTMSVSGSDNTAPALSGTWPSNITGQNNCFADADLSRLLSDDDVAELYSDGCGGTLTVSHTDANTSTDNCGWTITRTYTIRDACGNETTNTQSVSGSDQGAPTLTGTWPSNIVGQNNCFADADLSGLMSDDDVAALYYDACGGTATVTHADANTSTDNCGWTITRTYTITNACGTNSTTNTQSVSGSDQTAPTLTGTWPSNIVGQNNCFADADVSGLMGDADVAALYSDGCGGTISVTHADANTSTDNCGWTITRTYTISDACGNEVTNTQSVSGSDYTAPTLSGTWPSNITGQNNCFADADLSSLLSDDDVAELYSDGCGGTLTVSHTDANTSTDNCGWTITRTYTIRDACGNETTNTQSVSGSDQGAPTLTGTWPSNIVGQNNCFADADLSGLMSDDDVAALYNDGCGGTATVTHSDANTATDNCGWTITRTYTITNACGTNSTTNTQSVSGSDQTAPTLSGTWPTNITAQNNCFADADVSGLMSDDDVAALYSDGCGGNISVTHTDANATTDNCGWTITRTYTISDACGNEVTNTQSVSGSDQTAPTIGDDNLNRQLTSTNCVFTVPDLTSEVRNIASDNCTANGNLTISQSITAGTEITTATTVVVTVTDQCGNNSTKEIELTLPEELTTSLTAGTILCNGGIIDITNTVAGGTSPYTYYWTDDTHNQNNEGVSAGNYAVTVTDANGCSATSSIAISEPDELTASLSATEIPCHGVTSTITNTVEGGTTPYAYAWESGETSQNLTGVSGGTYSVTVTDANGCFATATITVTEPDQLTSSLSAGEIGCNGETTDITNTVNGGTTPITYTWSNGANTQGLTGVGAGTYSVTVTDNNGCSVVQSATISQPEALTASLSAGAIDCHGETTNITSTVNGGTQNYSYAWSNGATTNNLTDVGAGTYSVTVSDANSCTASAITTVSAPDALLVSISGSTSVCENTTSTLTANVQGGTADYTYLWSDNTTSSSITTSQLTTATEYSVTVTDANNCSASASVNVEIGDTPGITISDVTAICVGGNTILQANVSNAGSDYTVEWSSSDTGAGLPDVLNTDAITVTPTTAGTYTYTVSLTATSCSDGQPFTSSDNVQLLVNGLPDAAITNNTNETTITCSTTQISLTATGGTAYQWSNGGAIADNNITSADTYTVTVTDANGCSNTESIVITEDVAAPTVNIINETGTTLLTCTTTTINVEATGTGTSYLWSNEVTTATNAITTGGTYTVTATADNGCTSTAAIEITPNADAPTVSITNNSDTTVLTCSLTSINVTATGSGTSYEWSNGANTAENTLTAPGTYTVTATAGNGCSASDQITITQNTDAPEIIATASENSICNGESTTISATGGESYTWSPETGLPSTVGASLTATPDTTITYTVTGTGTNGCTGTAELTVTVNQTTESEFTETACDSYDWNSTTYTESGNYVQTLQTVNGCDSVVTLHLTIYNSQTEFVEVTACDSYEWAGETYTVSGNYEHTFTAVNGCDSVVTLRLTINNSQTNMVDVTACESYEWNSNIYTETGDYEQTFQTTEGCDSVVTLHLTISNTITNEISDTACDSFQWNDTTYYASGEYIQTFYTREGCDSVVTLNLTINYSTEITDTIVVCDSFEWEGQTYTESGEYEKAYTTVNGCDSIRRLNLTINQSLTESVEITACDSYQWNDSTYYASGDYEQTFQSVSGCDSVVTLHLTINHSTTNEVSAQMCSGVPYTYEGETFTEAGTYTVTLANSHGCDSIVTLTITYANNCGGIVSGIVTDENNGEPIYNARVTVGNKVTRTNAEGEYSIEVLRGRKTFRVSATGYISHSRSVDIQSDTVFNISLNAPHIETDVDSLTVSSFPYLEQSDSITLSNTGSGTLVWSSITEYDNLALVEDSVIQQRRNTRSLWDSIQTFATRENAEQAIATDGFFIYTSSWMRPGEFNRYTPNGEYVETFYVENVGSIRNLSYDGTHFYGTEGTNIIFKLDLDNQTLVDSIETDIQEIRHCSFNKQDGSLFAGSWNSLYRIDIENGTSEQIRNDLANVYSSAFDNLSPGGPYLWLFSQTSQNNGPSAYIRQFNISTGEYTDRTHYLDDINLGSSSLAGGICASEYVCEGKFVLLADVQNPMGSNTIATYEIGRTNNVVRTGKKSGSIAPNSSENISVKAGATETGDYSATIKYRAAVMGAYSRDIDVNISAVAPECDAVQQISIVTDTFHTVTLDWEPVELGNYESVSYLVFNTASQYAIDTVSGTTVTYDGLPVGEHCFTVMALSQAGYTCLSAASDTVCAEIQDIPCNVPLAVEARSDGESIMVSWNMPVGVDYVSLYRYSDPIDEHLTATSYVDTNVVPETDYCYIVIAHFENGVCDEISGNACIRIAADVCTQAPVLTVDAVSGSVALEWTESNGAVNYRVFRNDTFVGATNGTSYIDNVTESGEYCYRVESICEYGMYNSSEEVCISVDVTEDDGSGSGSGEGDAIEEWTADNLTLYPNPTYGQFFIEGQRIAVVQIFNASGMLVTEIENTEDERITINCEGWNPGLYNIRIISTEGETATRKVTVFR